MKILKRILSRLLGVFSTYDLVPAYDYVQNVTQWHLNRYIGLENHHEVKLFYIVGGYLGNEIPFLLKRYPKLKIKIFEASHRYQDRLENRFSKEDRVFVNRMAISDRIGTAIFNETNLRGSGSLLEVGSLASEAYGTRPSETFEVNTITLDAVSATDQIDCLWIDVQGAEMLVLRGGVNTLLRTRSVFTEVSLKPNLYIRSVTLRELIDFFSKLGFEMVLLGLDKENLTGNALFVRVQ